MDALSHIIFDLDGTLINSKRGIEKSLSYAYNQLNLKPLPGGLPDQFIGAPFQWCFQSLLGFIKKDAALAIEHFRYYYNQNGWKENIPYPGISELLEELHFMGKQLYVATSKMETFAEKILKQHEFDKYISHLKGADYLGKKSNKAILVSDLLVTQ